MFTSRFPKRRCQLADTILTRVDWLPVNTGAAWCSSAVHQQLQNLSTLSRVQWLQGRDSDKHCNIPSTSSSYPPDSSCPSTTAPIVHPTCASTLDAPSDRRVFHDIARVKPTLDKPDEASLDPPRTRPAKPPCRTHSPISSSRATSRLRRGPLARGGLPLAPSPRQRQPHRPPPPHTPSHRPARRHLPSWGAP